MTRKSKREIERLLEELAPAPRARATLSENSENTRRAWRQQSPLRGARILTMSETNTTDTTDDPDLHVSIHDREALEQKDEPGPLLLPVEARRDAYESLHDDAAAFIEVFCGLSEILNHVETDLRRPDRDGWDELEVQFIRHGVKVGHRVRDHDNWDAFLRHGWDAMPESHQNEARAALAPVAPMFGAEMTPPDDDEQFTRGQFDD